MAHEAGIHARPFDHSDVEEMNVYAKPQLIEHGNVVSRTLGTNVTETHESAFVATRPDDSVMFPVPRPIADKLINDVRKSFDPHTGQYVDETTGDPNEVICGTAHEPDIMREYFTPSSK